MVVSCGLMAGCGPDDGDPMGGESEDDTAGSTAANPGTDDGNTDALPEQTGGATDDGGTSGGGPMATTDQPDDGTSSGGAAGCQPLPVRLVVLGDSITACAGVGGADSADCASRQLADYVNDTIAPVAYQNYAVGGAVTADIPNNQLPDIEVGIAGHVLVMIYIGGNDLAPYIFASDQAAINGWNNTAGPAVAQAWEEILAFLGDEGNFPDGVTLLMNTQYNPFDDCTAAPYFVTEVKAMLLHEHNQALTDRANSRPWAFIADQHPSYLGHGHHVNVASCASYNASFDGWMNDLIHPNATGHGNLADVMGQVVTDQIYACE